MKNTFNVLIDEIPDQWCGVKINSSFKNVLRFFEITSNLKKESDIDYKTGLEIISLFFNEIPVLQEEIWDFILWFINRGKETKDDSDSEKTFDFSVDAGRIYSAFYQSYSIDLRLVDFHWWVFMELFENIPVNTRFMEVIDIRTKKEDKNDSKEYKAQIRKLKSIFAIDTQENNAELEARKWSNFFR
jgi:hypothetical protein